MKKLKILILMSTAGGGHASVAKALEEEFLEKGHEVVFFDALPSFLVPAYSIISRHFLPVWDFLFWTSNEKRAAEVLAKLSNKITEKKVAQKVISYRPDFIISDHPFITKMPEEIFVKNGRVPLGVVVVDPVTVHKIWFKGNPDILFIPTLEIKEEAIKAGVRPEKIFFSGYPIKRDFYKSYNLKVLRKHLGLPEEAFIAMVGGSSEGVGSIYDLCLSLAKLSLKLNFGVIAVCGRNKRLFLKLAEKFYYDERFKILGFERRMPDWVRASDIIISKAGPTHIYEAVAARKPFIAFSCMPGQEEGNLDLIEKEKIGIVEKDIYKITRLVKRWIRNPKLLEEYKEGIENLRRKQIGASKRIVEFIENYVLIKNKL